MGELLTFPARHSRTSPAPSATMAVLQMDRSWLAITLVWTRLTLLFYAHALQCIISRMMPEDELANAIMNGEC